MAGPTLRAVIYHESLLRSGILCVVAQSSCCSLAYPGNPGPRPGRRPQPRPLAARHPGSGRRAQQSIHDAQTSGDNAWVLVSAALVLMMTAPGLALFYGGLVRRKNILGTMMQSFAMMGLITVLWAVVGYSLAFGAGNGFIGGLEHVFLRGVGLDAQPQLRRHHPRAELHGLPAHVRHHHPGAHHRRLRRARQVQRHGRLSLPLVAGGLLPHGAHDLGRRRHSQLRQPRGRWPVFDFAGGTVVHITSGVSALVCALYVGKRVGYPQEDMPPHSMVLSFIGAGMLWVGWFGFNAGSALGAGPLATSAFVNTQFAAAAAAIGWVIAEWLSNGKPTALGAISGAVAGLATITQASGFVQPMSALAIGVIAGVVCSFMVFRVKKFFGYDDSLDAFGVHGVGGTMGALLTGLFAAGAINAVFGKDAAGNPAAGAIDGNWHQVVNQVRRHGHRLGAGHRRHSGPALPRR